MERVLKHLLSYVLKTLQATREYEYCRQRQEQLGEMLTANLTKEKNGMVVEVLFELGAAADRALEALYRQGLQDGVWLLKNLGGARLNHLCTHMSVCPGMWVERSKNKLPWKRAFRRFRGF